MHYILRVLSKLLLLIQSWLSFTLLNAKSIEPAVPLYERFHLRRFRGRSSVNARALCLLPRRRQITFYDGFVKIISPLHNEPA